MSLNKVFESKLLIRFPDCDPFNHLNNARYIDYFINAREDHVMKYHHFPIYQLAKEQGISWVVVKNQIAYLKPAFLMETVVIQTTILRLGDKDLQVEMRMWNEAKTSLKSLLWTSFVHFNLKTQKVEPHTPELMEQFKPYENLLKSIISFDERVEDLKSKKAEEIM